MSLCPTMHPWLSLAPGVHAADTTDAAYLHESSVLVFVYLPVLAGPADAVPPLNLWCSPGVQAALAPNARAPGSGFQSSMGGTYIPAPEAAARLHRLAVFLRSRTTSIPAVVLNDPTLSL